MASKGVFICIEGLDGCGKTTQTKLLVKRLSKTRDALYTAEPSDGRIGEFVKSYCLNSDKRCSSAVEALLFAADRLEHVESTVSPALKDGKIVVSDRYIYSSLAYQGATGLSLEWIKKVNVYSLPPDLALFIDVKPETVVQRLKPKRSVMENLETQRKVRDFYVKFVRNGELFLIDGNKPQNEVAEEITAVVEDFLGKPSCIGHRA